MLAPGFWIGGRKMSVVRVSVLGATGSVGVSTLDVIGDRAPGAPSSKS